MQETIGKSEDPGPATIGWTVSLSRITGEIYSVCLGLGREDCVCARGMVPATGVGLWPWGLVCTCVSSCGEWDPGLATAWTECLSLAAERINFAHMYMHSQ